MHAMLTKKRNLFNKRGFTLIELIVVIVILGVLAAIAIPRLSGFSSQAKWKADVATAKTIATAAMTVYTETGEKKTLLSDLVTAGYLETDVKPQYRSTGTFTLTWDANDRLAITDGSKALYPVPATDWK